jgi:2-keto-4-pentenoate hydratase/2-oxohepta-3-ene-1,7-dioic acid hydratase in catechol pathway
VRLLRADPAPAQVPRDRPQLRRSRRGGGLETPKFPTVFNKQSTCVVGPRDAIHLPRVSSALDYEGELGFVIGRRCRHVPRARATR